MTPKRKLEHDVKRDFEARVCKGVNVVLEAMLQKEMSQHLEVGYRERSPTRRARHKAATTSVSWLRPRAYIECLEDQIRSLPGSMV